MTRDCRREDAEVTSDYLHNVRVIARCGIVENRTKGIAASIIAAYDKKMGIERAPQAQKKESQHFGALKGRSTYTLRLVGETQWEGAYGTTYFYRFLDADGNVAVWKASGRVHEPASKEGNMPFQAIVEGVTYEIRATVKAHSEFKGIKQTVLTRCVVEKRVSS